MNEKNFIHLYDLYLDAIFRHCWFCIRNRELALDLTQETFLRAWKYVMAGKNIKCPKTFLFHVANNLVIDWSRKRKEVLTDTPEIYERVGADSAHREHKETQNNFDIDVQFVEVMKVLNTFDEESRRLIVMRYIDDLSLGEIARALDESANVVSVRLHRAMEKLKQSFAPYES